MDKILIGSEAIKYHYDDFPRKDFNDIDYLVKDKSQWNRTREIEYHENEVLWDYISKNDFVLNTNVIDISSLYTLKISHMFWNIHWNKHFWDLRFLNSKEIKFNGLLFSDLFNFWELRHGVRKTPDFTKTNDEFFYDNVKREYNHDDLHIVFAHYDEPLFNTIKDDQDRADVSKDLFDTLSLDKQVELINEEIYVLMMERYFLNNKNIPEAVAYNRILKKMIMNLTPLWMAVWILRHVHLFELNKNIKKTYEDNIWKLEN